MWNPIRVAKLALLLVLLGTVGFVAWTRGYFDGSPLMAALKPEMLRANWLVFFGIVAAVIGWIVSSWVTVRNLVKQHTMNTLLQTRLSPTYMAEARHVNKFLGEAGFSAENPAPLTVIQGASIEAKPLCEGPPSGPATPSPNPNLVAVDYILNFLEFLAVGIRHGDLHEKVLHDAMRGIVVNFTGTVQLYIDEARQVVNGKAQRPRTYENLLWLRNRWAD